MSRAGVNRVALFALALILPPATAGALWAGYAAITQRHAVAEHEIASGVRYQCRLVTPGIGHGWAHITKTDLTNPAISLYISPQLHEGSPFPYELQAVDHVAHDKNLIVAINGTLFGSDSELNSKLQRPGDPAYSTETVDSNGQLSRGRLPVDSRILWLERAGNGGLQGHWLDAHNMPTDALSHAYYAVGAQNSQLSAGKYDWVPDDVPDRRTAIGLDATGHTLFLAVFENASPKQVADTLRAEGASDVICLDGGHSSAQTVGGEVVTGNWRPVAVTIGVKLTPKQ